MFLNNWNSLEEMKADFWGNDSNKYNGELAGVKVILASYGTPSYEGYAFVLFERDGKLFEVAGSHCSCYGLEGQWKPEEITVEALRHRLNNGTSATRNTMKIRFPQNFVEFWTQCLLTLR